MKTPDPYDWLYRPRKRRVIPRVAAMAAIMGCVLTVSGAAARVDAAPARYSVQVAPVMQDYIDNCYPASASMYLSAFGIHVSQDFLAIQMHTYQDHGTNGQVAAQVIDAYLASRHLRIAGLTGLSVRAMAKTLAAQFRAGRPVMLAVRGNKMPWRLHTPATVHIMSATGISGMSVRVFDPSYIYGGWFTINASLLARYLVAAIIAERA